MLDKAAGYGADALILDLEDSVPLDRKAEAREMSAEFISGRAGDVPTYVRVNSVDSGLFEEDLEAIVLPGLRGIQCPKTDSPEMIRVIDQQLSMLEEARSLAPGSVEVIVGIESVAGVYNCFEILSSAARVGSCVVGVAVNGDLQRDVGYNHSESGIESLYIRSKVIVEARHAGITNPLDGTYPAIRDMEGFEAEASRARQLGYRGKKLIHPAQIEPTNRIFMPTDEEIDFQERVLAALDEAEKEGRAATTVDGLMVDIAMAVNARRVLEWADQAR
ncbi:MAG: CoA ester lyase [Acidimicrobiia bacterium]|nr:CoA ester lyase [Acidimicrobiia bacterium]